MCVCVCVCVCVCERESAYVLMEKRIILEGELVGFDECSDMLSLD